MQREGTALPACTTCRLGCLLREETSGYCYNGGQRNLRKGGKLEIMEHICTGWLGWGHAPGRDRVFQIPVQADIESDLRPGQLSNLCWIQPACMAIYERKAVSRASKQQHPRKRFCHFKLCLGCSGYEKANAACSIPGKTGSWIWDLYLLPPAGECAGIWKAPGKKAGVL